jgi:hypothetical protein
MVKWTSLTMNALSDPACLGQRWCNRSHNSRFRTICVLIRKYPKQHFMSTAHWLWIGKRQLESNASHCLSHYILLYGNNHISKVLEKSWSYSISHNSLAWLMTVPQEITKWQKMMSGWNKWHTVLDCWRWEVTQHSWTFSQSEWWCYCGCK